jgi:hypothetical protein
VIEPVAEEAEEAETSLINAAYHTGSVLRALGLSLNMISLCPTP